MLKLEIELEDPDEELTGFNMGYMTFHGDRGVATSKGKSPSQAMMVLLSIVMLLDGLRNFKATNGSNYEYVGIDSSFIVDFEKQDNNLIKILIRDQVITVSDMTSILNSVYRDVKNFLHDILPRLPESDIAYQDLNLSLSKFEILLKECGKP